MPDTDAYDSFVYLFKSITWDSFEQFVSWLRWLPEADHLLIELCAREYVAEYMSH